MTPVTCTFIGHGGASIIVQACRRRKQVPALYFVHLLRFSQLTRPVIAHACR
jgi:hypothetical protein